MYIISSFKHICLSMQIHYKTIYKKSRSVILGNIYKLEAPAIMEVQINEL